MFDNKHVGAWDVYDTDVIVTIDRVVMEEIKDRSGRTDRCGVLYFKGGKRGMIMNVTNSQTIVDMYGPLVEEMWPGKRIRLYSDTCRHPDGKVGPCVRVRAGVPDSSLKDGKVGQPGDPQGPDGVPSGADELRTALGDEE